VLLTVLTLSVAACGGSTDTEAESRLDAGRVVFTTLSQPKCVLCHTLEDAGASGNVGPNLDRLKPNVQMVVTAVTSGVGAMPPQGDHLTGEQIRAVAFYVAQVTGGADSE
jgi:cytochrome c6